MSDRAREIAEGIVALWVNEHKDAGSKLVHHGLPLGVWLPRECSDLVARIAEGIDAEVAERVGVLRAALEQALCSIDPCEYPLTVQEIEAALTTAGAPGSRDASARATLERMPVINDPVISEAMRGVEEAFTSDGAPGSQEDAR